MQGYLHYDVKAFYRPFTSSGVLQWPTFGALNVQWSEVRVSGIFLWHGFAFQLFRALLPSWEIDQALMRGECVRRDFFPGVKHSWQSLFVLPPLSDFFQGWIVHAK